MSRDLLRRKKKRFLKTGGLNPPVDLADFAVENAEASPVTETVRETGAAVSGPEMEKNSGDEYLDLVFADLFRTQEMTQHDYVPDYIRRGKKAVVLLLSILLGLTFAYNAGYIDVIQTEVDSFVIEKPNYTVPVAEERPIPESMSGTIEGTKEERITLFLTCDGETGEYVLKGSAASVSDLLEQAGVTLSDDDIVEPGIYDVLGDRDSVRVTRIRYTEYTVTETIPASTEIKLTPLLYDGEQRELYAYDKEDGEKELTYRDKYVDGVLTEHEVIDETVISYPVNSLTMEGAAVSMSPINGARFTDIMINDNAPESYISSITGYCTAYNFDEGVWGASGMYLSQGFVAVDPSVIPYGSLLYITNYDGSFVYGWAIAADYCQAAAEGRVAVDLFFDTYQETLWYGKHTMNIYVVKQLYRDELQEYVARQGYFDNRVPGRP